MAYFSPQMGVLIRVDYCNVIEHEKPFVSIYIIYVWVVTGWFPSSGNTPYNIQIVPLL
jgi:hypothetical protein